MRIMPRINNGAVSFIADFHDLLKQNNCEANLSVAFNPSFITELQFSMKIGYKERKRGRIY